MRKHFIKCVFRGNQCHREIALMPTVKSIHMLEIYLKIYTERKLKNLRNLFTKFAFCVVNLQRHISNLPGT